MTTSLSCSLCSKQLWMRILKKGIRLLPYSLLHYDTFIQNVLKYSLKIKLTTEYKMRRKTKALKCLLIKKLPTFYRLDNSLKTDKGIRTSQFLNTDRATSLQTARNDTSKNWPYERYQAATSSCRVSLTCFTGISDQEFKPALCFWLRCWEGLTTGIKKTFSVIDGEQSVLKWGSAYIHSIRKKVETGCILM